MTTDVASYIETHFFDITALVFNPRTREYQPHDKHWVKQMINNYISRSR